MFTSQAAEGVKEMVLEEKPALAEEEESDDEAIDMEVSLQIKIWAIIGLA